MTLVRFAVIALAVAGCSAGPDDTDPLPPAEPRYLTIDQLHEQGIARTCSPNQGVCHNSKEYPDLHSVTALLDAVDKPCGIAATDRLDVRDPCEPVGDRLVVDAIGLDAEILRVEQSPADAEPGAIDSVRIVLATPVDAAPMEGESAVAVHRGDIVFDLGAARVTVRDSDRSSVTLGLAGAAPQARTFLDDRVYPWTGAMVRVADPNGNRIAGAALDDVAMLVTPGKPLASWIVRRLMDERMGDLMPRQCRTWNDEATRALGCWIAGLRTDPDGRIVDADAPIDYDACDFDPTGLGKCVDVIEDGFAGVEAIFSRSCGGGSCHVDQEQAAAGLDLSPGKAYQALVDVAATGVPAARRVVPGSPDDSYLLCKLDPGCEHRVGAAMPLGSLALPEAELERIRTWIADGAANH